MAQDRNNQSSDRQAGNRGQQSTDRNDASRFDRESAVGQGSSDRSSKRDRSAQREDQSMRDNQQIADDNQQSGGVETERMSNHASEMEQAEGSRENAGGISNRELGEERENQSRVPRRGENKDGGHA